MNNAKHNDAQGPFAVDFHRPDHFIDSGSDRIATWRVGSGPDVVLVHGWPLTAATWRHLVPVLAPHFTCHLIDLPGAGMTECTSNRPVSIADHVETVMAVVEHLELRQLAFIAQDSGATITRLAAARLGDRVFANVMGNTEVPFHRPWMVVAFGVMLRVFGVGLFRRILASPTLLRSPLGYGSSFSDPSTIDGEFHDFFVRPLLDDTRKLHGQVRLLAGWNWSHVDALAEEHKRITGPVKLIWGERDSYFPLSQARDMVFPGGMELAVIENMKLMVHEEAPDEFGTHTLSFLREHTPEGAITSPVRNRARTA